MGLPDSKKLLQFHAATHYYKLNEDETKKHSLALRRVFLLEEQFQRYKDTARLNMFENDILELLGETERQLSDLIKELSSLSEKRSRLLSLLESILQNLFASNTKPPPELEVNARNLFSNYFGCMSALEEDISILFESTRIGVLRIEEELEENGIEYISDERIRKVDDQQEYPEIILPIVKITQEQKDSELQCTVCIVNFRVGQLAKIVPCQHIFHDKCIKEWLYKKSTCPNCRKHIESSKYQKKTKKRSR